MLAPTPDQVDGLRHHIWSLRTEIDHQIRRLDTALRNYDVGDRDTKLNSLCDIAETTLWLMDNAAAIRHAVSILQSS